MKNLSQTWESALLEIQKIISQANFSTWFKETEILRIEDNIVYLGVPNSFSLDWLKKKFHVIILDSLKGIQAEIIDLKYVNINSGEISSYVKKEQPENYLSILNKKIDYLDEKSESLVTRVVFLTGRVESLMGKVSNVLSQVSKAISVSAEAK